MKYCANCGNQIQDGVKFCPACGGNTGAASAQPQGAGFTDKIRGMNTTADTTGHYDAKDIADNKVMAILSYFGFLCFIPLLAAPNSRFARFHANQGLILFICEVAFGIVYAILTSIFWGIGAWGLAHTISVILGILWLIPAIVAVIGIINASQGIAKELPLIGKFKIIK